MDNKTIKNEINKKYILSHEYKSIVDDEAKLQKETEYKQQKMIVRKVIFFFTGFCQLFSLSLFFVYRLVVWG